MAGWKNKSRTLKKPQKTSTQSCYTWSLSHVDVLLWGYAQGFQSYEIHIFIYVYPSIMFFLWQSRDKEYTHQHGSSLESSGVSYATLYELGRWKHKVIDLALLDFVPIHIQSTRTVHSLSLKNRAIIVNSMVMKDYTIMDTKWYITLSENVLCFQYHRTH